MPKLHPPLALLTSAVLLLSCAVPANAEEPRSYSPGELYTYAEKAVSYERELFGAAQGESIFRSSLTQQAGTDYADWIAVGISRLGLSEDYDRYYSAWVRAAEEPPKKATDGERAVLVCLAVGGDPTDAEGWDILSREVFCRQSDPAEQGLNGTIWALIAADSLDWAEPPETVYSRDYLLSQLTSAQNPDGGFSLSPGGQSEPDLTAMALQALSPYQKEQSQSVSQALGFLEQCCADGGELSCETTAQIIIALCCLGIRESGQLDIRELTEQLISYSCPDGGFKHLLTDRSPDPSATAQAVLAIAALIRLEKNLPPVYYFGEDLPPADGIHGRNTSGQGYIFDIMNETEVAVSREKAAPKKQHKPLSPALPAAAAVLIAGTSALMIRRKHHER
ncbi:MAG: terpene cyclase/mutase family protein [Ruminococcus sp.]|nr:terpene cyclase/mutase family protein [Ruminococcus sp.]